MYIPKILLVGSGGCGKSTYLQTIAQNEFEKRYIPTYNSNNVTINHCNRYFEIIDTAGQESMKKFENMEFNGVMIMFDVASIQSYKNAEHWYNKLKNKNVPIVFVGNKFDLNKTLHRVKDNNRLLNIVPYFQISVKNKENILDPIEHFC